MRYDIASYFFCSVKLEGTEATLDVFRDFDPLNEIVYVRLQGYFTRKGCDNLFGCMFMTNNNNGYINFESNNAEIAAVLMSELNPVNAEQNNAEILGDPYAKKSPLQHIGPITCLPVSPSIPSHRILGTHFH